MFLKIMNFEAIKDKEHGGHEHISTTIHECKSIRFADETFEGISFTVFIVDENKPTEKAIRIDDTDKAHRAVYIMNDNGKTIQQPV